MSSIDPIYALLFLFPADTQVFIICAAVQPNMPCRQYKLLARPILNPALLPFPLQCYDKYPDFTQRDEKDKKKIKLMKSRCTDLA